MKKALVTGCAGFIGSHLTERLLQEGYKTTGIDGFVSNYDIASKQRNIRSFADHPHFTFYQTLLQTEQWEEWLEGVEVVYHQAALPGVRSSWGRAFASYVEHNLIVTQRLLDACREQGSIKKIVIASSSSVYGTMPKELTNEHAPQSPLSPYGVTKAAMEQLCQAYVKAYALPIVILRYFTVYGPRQRPDMAFQRFFRNLLRAEPLQIYGDGQQSRDFTYVSDAVEANLRAARCGAAGDVYNIGGNREISLNEVIACMAEVAGVKPQLQYLPEQVGDSRRTCADITLAKEKLGYAPRVSLEDGLRLQFQSLLEADRRDMIGPSPGIPPQIFAEE